MARPEDGNDAELPSLGPGSWIAPLETVLRCVHVVRSFSSYLSVMIQGPDGVCAEFALGRQIGFAEGSAFEKLVVQLRP
jgi:hypothetical protein